MLVRLDGVSSFTDLKQEVAVSNSFLFRTGSQGDVADLSSVYVYNDQHYKLCFVSIQCSVKLKFTISTFATLIQCMHNVHPICTIVAHVKFRECGPDIFDNNTCTEITPERSLPRQELPRSNLF